MIPDPFTAITTHDGAAAPDGQPFDLTVKVKRPATKEHAPRLETVRRNANSHLPAP